MHVSFSSCALIGLTGDAGITFVQMLCENGRFNTDALDNSFNFKFLFLFSAFMLYQRMLLSATVTPDVRKQTPCRYTYMQLSDLCLYMRKDKCNFNMQCVFRERETFYLHKFKAFRF
jgi:hypothetical protein